MSRVPRLDLEKLAPEQRKVYDAIVAGPRGRVVGPLLVWLQSPGLADRAEALGAFCRFGTSLPPRLSELVILVTGAHWQAAFEWHEHAPIGLNVGLDVGTIEAIRVGKPPNLAKNDEAAVYAFAKELLDTRKVCAATYERAIAEIGLTAVVELVGILGYYSLVSMTINAFEVPPPDGAPQPFVS
jgi:4-carboxymuconolactone decarboxylase